MLIVPIGSPIRTMADFIALGRDGKFTVADSGVGTTNHIAIELIGEATGTRYELVHYKGSGQAHLDLIAGQVPAQVDQVNAAIGHIKAGKMRAIAVSSDARVPELPDVPTMKESRRQGPGDLHLQYLHRPVRAGQAAARDPGEAQCRHGDGARRSCRHQALRRPHGSDPLEHAAGAGGDARQGRTPGRAAHQEAGIKAE